MVIVVVVDVVVVVVVVVVVAVVDVTCRKASCELSEVNIVEGSFYTTIQTLLC